MKSAGNAVIPTFPVHCPHGLQHLRHKRRNAGFKGLRRVHTRLRQQDRTQALTRRNTGRFGWGVLSLPSGCFARFGNPARPGVRTANFAAFGSWLGVLSKNTESLRNSDAHNARRCSEALRPRWAAGTYSFVTAWSFLHRYQSANSWNFRSRLLDVPTSIAKPSVFCYNILKSR